MSAWHLKERSSLNPAPRKETAFKDGRVVNSNRDWKLLILFFVVAIALIVQLVHLQVFAAQGLREEAKQQRMDDPVIHAKRGTIFDRNGNVLAMDVEVTTICANPKLVKNPRATADLLASVLGGKADDYYQKLTQDAVFVYIKQQADTTVANALIKRDADLQKQADEAAKAAAAAGATTQAGESTTLLTGIYYVKDTKRYYPYGSVGAQVIGGVSLDDTGKYQGTYGLELLYDNILCGTDGMLYTEYSLQMGNRPMSGQPIPGSERQEDAPVAGCDIVVSLDIDLQQYAEAELARVGKERACDVGSVLLLDGATGEIYATASLPLMDRDNLTQEAVEKGATSLGSICNTYEPGSIFKAVTAAAVLEEDAMKPEEQILVPGWRNYDTGDDIHTVTDAWEHGDEMMSFADIITYSSNIGMTLVEERLSNEVFYNYLQGFGFGQATHVDYPGEGVGELHTPDGWSELEQGNISFGQGVSTTPVAMASFYGAIANGGLMCPPHFIINQPESMANLEVLEQDKQLFSPKTAKTLESMLQSVVTTGTGTTAAVEGYAMAGKTGTAQKARPLEEGGGYIDDEYIVSFVGYFANTNSKLVCITCMDNPQGADGDSPTGPLFASIMRYVANRYLIEPQDAAAAAAVAASAGGAAASAGQPGEGQGQDGADPYTADDDDDWTDPDTSADEPTYGEGADTPVYYSDTDEDNTGG